MDSPGAFTLGDFTVGAPATQAADQQAGPLVGLDGMDAASLQVRLSGGAGGTKINVYIQTSLDQGQSWFDIANVAFANTPGVEVLNLSALDHVVMTAPGNLSLADNTVLDGLLGDRLQAVVVSTGTYTGQTLVSVRGCAR